MAENTIVVTHLDEKNDVKRIHFQFPDKAETKYLTKSQWLKEKEKVEVHCKKNNMRLVYNFTGGFDIPELREEEAKCLNQQTKQ